MALAQTEGAFVRIYAFRIAKKPDLRWRCLSEGIDSSSAFDSAMGHGRSSILDADVGPRAALGSRARVVDVTGVTATSDS
jgi:hypothetical protein